MDIKKFAKEFQTDDPTNRIPASLAKNPEYINRMIYDGVLVGVAAADDEVIASLRDNEKANIDMTPPEEWLPGAKSVISVFMPFSRWITDENVGGDWPSDAWFHGRIEGQSALNRFIQLLTDQLREEGYESIVPTLDPRFKVDKSKCASNWSERHVAYAAGLGTFGLSRGIITELGMAGRFISLITNQNLDPTPRPYAQLYEYCIKCLSCAGNCPVDAISIAHLKDNKLCDAFVDKVRLREEPYYGCGKCQSGVPCAFGIPVDQPITAL